MASAASTPPATPRGRRQRRAQEAGAARLKHPRLVAGRVGGLRRRRVLRLVGRARRALAAAEQAAEQAARLALLRSGLRLRLGILQVVFQALDAVLRSRPKRASCTKAICVTR